MPKVKAASPSKRKKVTQAPAQAPPPAASSILFGLVMVVALIVTGAALLGGSLSKMEQRWANALDGVSRSLGISVARVEVIGLEHDPELARLIRDAAMIVPGENMFRADPHLLRRRVENTNRVEHVSVYRLWPDTVMIRVDAARPTALWYDGKDWRVVDSLGRPMQDQSVAAHADLLKASGNGAATALPALVSALADYPELLVRLERAQRISQRRWDLIFQTGLRVNLPADSGLDAGLARLASLEARSRISSLAVARLDLRISGRSTLSPAGEDQINREAA